MSEGNLFSFHCVGLCARACAHVFGEREETVLKNVGNSLLRIFFSSPLLLNISIFSLSLLGDL